MHSKHKIDSRHEFALVYLQDAAFWVRQVIHQKPVYLFPFPTILFTVLFFHISQMSDFTSEPSKIITILEDMSTCAPTANFDMSSIFDVM